ncbi:uracil-DNA glycosylase [Cuniculiplasma sp. SKW3]|uniref:uracil-DNA glycosylase n=1 Tax=Cuniculiplasma sp. SKW3 TaxID=3400170 RepID=UPI003FD2D580
MIGTDLNELYDEITQCKKCKRLVEFRESVLKDSKKYEKVTFWRKPLHGYGNIKGRMMIIGLAPAASGGNRTGRVFTGDKSSDFLVSCLYEAGITNIPTSTRLDDGLEYIDAYITLAVRCVPPDNKPAKEEMENCFPYLQMEYSLMKNLRSIIALGKIAFDSALKILKENGYSVSGIKFGNNLKYQFGEVRLYSLFHPSPRNVNTGKINRKEFIDTLMDAKIYSTELEK